MYGHTLSLPDALPIFLSAGVLPEVFAVPVGMAALLLLLALTAGRARNPLEWGPLHHLGEISYATYLSHFLLFVVFKLLMVSDASAVPPVLLALDRKSVV